MRLAEILNRRDYLVGKIDQTEAFLRKLVELGNTDSEELIKIRRMLDSYYEDCQRLSMKLERANNQVDVQVGNSKIKLTDAIKIRNTILRKIRNINDLISNSNGNVNFEEFVQQRDQLYEEYVVLMSSISLADWSTDVD